MWNLDDTYTHRKRVYLCSYESLYVSAFACAGTCLSRPHVAPTCKPPITHNQHNALIHNIGHDTCTSLSSTAVAQHRWRRRYIHLHHSFIAKKHGGTCKHITSDRAFATLRIACARCIIIKMQCVPCASTQALLLECHQAPDTHPTACSFHVTVGISRC